VTSTSEKEATVDAASNRRQPSRALVAALGAAVLALGALGAGVAGASSGGDGGSAGAGSAVQQQERDRDCPEKRGEGGAPGGQDQGDGGQAVSLET
jgi:hypothetical protein